MTFSVQLELTATRKKSNIILALDFPFEKAEQRRQLLSTAQRVLGAAYPFLCAVKINHHLTLPLGLFDGVQSLVQKAHDLGLLAIMDCKVNDIGATNQVIAEYYYSAGFDALIANPFIGWEEGLKPIFDVAGRTQRGVILLVYMSHKGALEGYGQTVVDAETGEKTPQYITFAKKALQYKAGGAIVGATYPEKIREIHHILKEKVPIISPGIGAQGGEVEAAIKAGARYLIVGRAVAQAADPAAAAKAFRDSAKQAL
ncbi:MAG: orotidine 5'-phosphate decarboxylase [Candidatus Bathyarchaeota archaeon]|nr:orotidine 5'-phosphate decarboxylase [Candidatus Bathyarchaeota archaeon]